MAIGSFNSSRGEYRKTGVIAGKTTFPNYMKVEGMVRDLCETINEKIDKVSTLESKDPMRKFLFEEQTRGFERAIDQDRFKDKGRFFTLI